MGGQDKRVVGDTLAWLGNVLTSVLIVFVNKVLMDPKTGYKFTFATTLCAFHFLTCAAGIWIAQFVGMAESAKLPLGETLYFAVIANLSIASLNLSLLLNPVGFYQIAKLLIIPFVCLVEMVWLKRTFTPPVVGSVLTVIVGVGIVTVNEVTSSANLVGVIIAGISVITSGMQQILCGVIQRKHKMASHQLLANTAPAQGAMLLVIGPWVDLWLGGKWIMAYEYSVPALLYLTLSCVVAVAVNISQFMCLGRFSAVTFQVLGHTKTLMVLLISWAVFHEHMSARKLLGMVLAVSGMVAYGYFNAIAAQAPKRVPETLPLLSKERPPRAERQPDTAEVVIKASVAQEPSAYELKRSPSVLRSAAGVN